MNVKTLKVLGLIVAGVSAALSVAASIIADKQQDIKIMEAATEAVAKLTQGES